MKGKTLVNDIPLSLKTPSILFALVLRLLCDHTYRCSYVRHLIGSKHKTKSLISCRTCITLPVRTTFVYIRSKSLYISVLPSFSEDYYQLIRCLRLTWLAPSTRAPPPPASWCLTPRRRRWSASTRSRPRPSTRGRDGWSRIQRSCSSRLKRYSTRWEKVIRLSGKQDYREVYEPKSLFQFRDFFPVTSA